MADGDIFSKIPANGEEEVDLDKELDVSQVVEPFEEVNGVNGMSSSGAGEGDRRPTFAEIAKKAEAVKEHDVPEEEEEQAEKLEEEMKKEVEENDGWMKILGNEELMKKVITPGQLNTNPQRGDICTLNFEGRLAENEEIVFEKMSNLKIQVGDTEVIPGLDLTIPLMTIGEVATIRVSQRFGYGSKGWLPKVPANANLVFQLELVHSEPEKELTELSVTERREIGNRKRERGNWWFGRDESSLAVNCYRRALEYLDEAEGGIQLPDGKPLDDITPEIRLLFDDRLKTLNNLALAQLKLQSYEPALTSVEAVLKCQPNNVKALFRKGKILGAKGETEKALEVLQRAKMLEPEDTGIAAEIVKLGKRRKEEHKSEKLLYKRMFKDAAPTAPNSDNNEEKTQGSRLTTLTAGLLLTGAAVAVAGVMAYRGFRQR